MNFKEFYKNTYDIDVKVGYCPFLGVCEHRDEICFSPVPYNRCCRFLEYEKKYKNEGEK